MAMSKRVARLRQESLDIKPFISAERAQLITEFYRNQTISMSEPVKRANAFWRLMNEKAIWIGEGELIVGERGPSPKATPTYPEICCHKLEDLAILNSRELTPYAVSEETTRIFESAIIPFWKGGTIREMIFNEMTSHWKTAYDSGVFTEFMEQRAPGHTVLDNKIYNSGFIDFRKDIAKSLHDLDFLNDPEAYHKQEQLKAMDICADALILYGKRCAQKAEELADCEKDPQRKKELIGIAQVCRHVPAHAPRNFHEALQSYWFVHLGVICELNTWDSFNPGHLDHHLFPFYRSGVEEGTLTREAAEELLQCFWIKFNNQPAPPKVGVTASESGTYTDFAQINTGGISEDGSDAVNEVTYLLLDVIEEMRLLQPSSSVQVSKKNPDRFLKRAAKIIRTGFGQPSIFNADLIVQELVRQGKSISDARCGGSSGCVEVGAFGKENYNLTGYINLPKIMEITINNGIDSRTGKRIGLKTGEILGDTKPFSSFDSFFNAFEKQLKHFVDIKHKGNNVIERLYAAYMPSPCLSLLTDDCIKTGKDYHDGGARYNTSYIQGVGLGVITDAMTAVKHHVFDKGSLTFKELSEALCANFEGNEKLRLMLVNKTPKYGNDDDYADSIMKTVFEAYYNAVEGRKNTRGGEYHINLLPTTAHVYFGSITGATANGRFAAEPLSEGVSPVQGADRLGPTAVLKSVAKMDHVRTGGTLLNMKLTPHILDDDEGLNKFVHLVRAYFKMDGHHVQFNVVDSETLKEALINPEKHRDLIVRVAGYSDYFCDLGRSLQEEIITRTEHNAF